MVRFSVYATASKMPRHFFRRVTFRNSKIRQDASGYANYERVWLLGFDVTVMWGRYSPAKPDETRLGGVVSRSSN